MTTAPPTHRPAIAVLTSGGDAPGMNAVVRAVVRTAIGAGADVFAVYEGLQGLVDGGQRIERFGWSSVGSVQHRGGTVIGTARSADFRTREGRRRAALHLLERGIDRLVVVGGDGSLTGTDVFRSEWPDLLDELVEAGEVPAEIAARHGHLVIAGVVGSIDNDMVGTDMTVGADTALHRIVDAIDALASTAASHQRSFVVEVMGRHCGYLALMSAIAGGADYVLIPENPPADGWEDEMCERLRAGRAAGRRESIVVVAEGATDRHGNPITSGHVRDVLAERLAEDVRVTILGHVQRGGAPSAYDRWMPTLLGHAAALEVVHAGPDHEPQLIGVRNNRVHRTPLMSAVERTRQIPGLIQAGDYRAAMAARGSSFTDMVEVFDRIAQANDEPSGGARIAVVHGGGLAPGMNTAVRAAVRFGQSRGHTMLGVQGSFLGLVDGRIDELAWGDVDGWVGSGGAELGTRRAMPRMEQYYAVSRALENNEIDALLVVGGHRAYQAVHDMHAERDRYPGFGLPVICLPATIDNNLPGWETTIGADTALNEIVTAVDRLKQSAMASQRAFVVEVMGRYCGYLALMGALSTGAERVYLHEEGVTLADLSDDVARMVASFRAGRRFHLAIRNEAASEGYTTEVMCRLFAEESAGEFDVRPMVLGHLQQGGNPTPFDRVHATRLAAFCVDWLSAQISARTGQWAFVGSDEGRPTAEPIRTMADLVDSALARPREQWWLDLRPVMAALATEPDAR
ncbi:6-phosphofructokinase [Isoptericola sp. b441]|uniref:6-phosphofructokinase n=1 Tax=Actinotalea lenta TaxID=3064654 RepID=A0ABT9D9U8_9CELL|nr:MULTISPECIES: 6-phosphofructokinase [unclassified Isoptericola]MDO8107656.1 6-phosphofructokinase [Isoptericola sp. b441]MDO8120684.1 6-phosphofructokinase [Isoptericola sp. b490]